ncbi:MAG: hypothetical protein AB1374_05860 [Bacillota bacterium]
MLPVGLRKKTKQVECVARRRRGVLFLVLRRPGERVRMLRLRTNLSAGQLAAAIRREERSAGRGMLLRKTGGIMFAAAMIAFWWALCYWMGCLLFGPGGGQ